MKKELIFYGLVDFFECKELLRSIYNGCSIDEIEVFKLYVYSLPFMKDDIKDLIWDYLNGYDESQFNLSKEYRKAKEKLERRKREIEEL